MLSSQWHAAVMRGAPPCGRDLPERVLFCISCFHEITKTCSVVCTERSFIIITQNESLYENRIQIFSATLIYAYVTVLLTRFGSNLQQKYSHNDVIIVKSLANSATTATVAIATRV